MRKLLTSIFLLLSVFLFAQIEKAIPNSQNPPKLVNDFSEPFFLQPYQREALEKKLVAYDDSTSNQITIVIVDGLEGYSRDEYAISLGNKWGVGGKDFNNGVVVLISTGKKDKKRTSFIATGYGLEGALPDLTVKSIIDNELTPELKNGNYYRALDLTTDAIIRAAEGRYKAPAGYANKGEKGISLFQIMLIIFLGIILLSIISRGGGKNGGMMSRRGYRDWNGPVWFPSSGGGWSGGGSGGSGFGGFGGGGFGGGGAGGDW